MNQEDNDSVINLAGILFIILMLAVAFSLVTLSNKNKEPPPVKPVITLGKDDSEIYVSKSPSHSSNNDSGVCVYCTGLHINSSGELTFGQSWGLGYEF